MFHALSNGDVSKSYILRQEMAKPTLRCWRPALGIFSRVALRGRMESVQCGSARGLALKAGEGAGGEELWMQSPFKLASL